LAEVAVQLGDAVATVAGSYTHAFVGADALPREPAADAIDAARNAAGVRKVYVELETTAGGEAANPASGERADARTRTADPFITSDDGDAGKPLQFSRIAALLAGSEPAVNPLLHTFG
jgi:hypothetical protein